MLERPSSEPMPEVATAGGPEEVFVLAPPPLEPEIELPAPPAVEGVVPAPPPLEPGPAAPPRSSEPLLFAPIVGEGSQRADGPAPAVSFGESAARAARQVFGWGLLVFRGLGAVFEFYWTRRQGLWRRIAGSGDPLREFRLSAADDYKTASFDATGWKVGLPDCCVVCGDPIQRESMQETRWVEDLTGPLWFSIAGVVVGLALACWKIWLFPLPVLIALVLGYHSTRTVQVRWTLRRCALHSVLIAIPEAWAAGNDLVVHVGQKRVKELFLLANPIEGPALTLPLPESGPAGGSEVPDAPALTIPLADDEPAPPTALPAEIPPVPPALPAPQPKPVPVPQPKPVPAPQPKPVVRRRPVGGRLEFPPIDPRKLSIRNLACSPSPMVLRLNSPLARLEFDHRQRLLIAQHAGTAFGLSASQLGTWRPTACVWGLDEATIRDHPLARALGNELQILVKIIPSSAAPQGRYLHVQVVPPMNPSDFHQRAAHLIWDVERGAWISGTTTGFLAIPHYWAGDQHLAMEQDRTSLRIMPAESRKKRDFNKAPFALAGLCTGVVFGPLDEYVITHAGAAFQMGKLVTPFSAAAYSPASTQPLWQRSYSTLPFVRDGQPWTVPAVALTPNEDILGIVRIDRDDATEWRLLDVAAGTPLGEPFRTESKIVQFHGVAAARALVAYEREPNVLEVSQIGRTDPVLLRLAVPSTKDGAVSCFICPQGNYIAVYYPQELAVRVYTLIEERE